MASNLQAITSLFLDEVLNVTKNQDNWKAFLKTAANNYKYFQSMSAGVDFLMHLTKQNRIGIMNILNLNLY